MTGELVAALVLVAVGWWVLIRAFGWILAEFFHLLQALLHF